MVEARGSEVPSQLVRQPGVVAEHDALDDAAPVAGEATGSGPPEPGAQPVREARQAVATADDPPPVAAKDGVDALAPKPGGFVEAMRRSARADELSEYLEASTLRRRAAERQLEENRLVDDQAAEAGDTGREPELEPPAARRTGYGHRARLCPADARGEDASVELVRAPAAPPHGGEERRADGERRASLRTHEGRAGRGHR